MTLILLSYRLPKQYQNLPIRKKINPSHKVSLSEKFRALIKLSIDKINPLKLNIV